MAQLLPPPRVQAGRLITTRSGLSRHPFGDLYHWLLRAHWGLVILAFFGGYLATNALFAALFLAGGPCFGVAEPRFFDAFMFSVQTYATIGYGVMAPTTTWAHALVAIESFVGVLTAGMMTGLMFAKFARPSSRIAFATHAVVSPRDGVPTLQLRMANERASEILSARAELFLIRDEVSVEGQHFRRFVPLRLERDASPLFALSWTLLHPIDAQSPLYGLTEDTAASRIVGLSVLVQGTDDTSSSTVIARYYYLPSDLRFGRRFADMMERRPTGMHIHHDRLDDLVAPEPPARDPTAPPR
jgi:inward rectifier potassium channel